MKRPSNTYGNTFSSLASGAGAGGWGAMGPARPAFDAPGGAGYRYGGGYTFRNIFHNIDDHCFILILFFFVKKLECPIFHYESFYLLKNI